MNNRLKSTPMQHCRFSLVQRASNVNVTMITAHELRAICKRNGKSVELLRGADPFTAATIKRDLSAVCWAATFKDGKRHAESAEPTGLCYIDIDHVSEWWEDKTQTQTQTQTQTPQPPKGGDKQMGGRLKDNQVGLKGNQVLGSESPSPAQSSPSVSVSPFRGLGGLGSGLGSCQAPISLWSTLFAGRELAYGIVHAQVSPSGDGLHIVFLMPEGCKTVEEGQKEFALCTELPQYDVKCHDIARMLFLSGNEDTLFDVCDTLYD